MKKILLSIVSLAVVGVLFYSYYYSSNSQNQTADLSSYSGEQKNICSITINSEDEITTFKQKLSSDNRFKFTELVTGDEKWFDRACSQNIQCDVLVISGHFGGTFFGKTGHHLSLSELETKSCSRKCTGILEKPKEIYLFGCNTLAGKDPDTRTPEQYLAVLLEDGLERSFAERVVESRYGPSGEKNLNRMKRSFPGVPAIYGFCEKAPLGSESGPVMKNYLSSQGKDYFQRLNDLEQSQKTLQPYSAETLTALQNTKLAASFKNIGRCFRQTTGINTNDDVANRICAVRNMGNTIEARAADLDFLMRSNENLGYIELCIDFFNETKKMFLNGSQQDAVNKVKDNPKLREDISALLKRVTFFLAYDYATLGIDLGLTPANLSPLVSQSFAKIVKKGLTIEEINLMINSDFKNPMKNLLQIDFSMIDSPAVWANGNSIEAIGLTGTQDPKILAKLQELIYSGQPTIQKSLLQALIRLNAVNIALKDGLIKLLSHTDADVRANACKALAMIKTFDQQIVNEVIAMMNRENDPWAQKNATLYFTDMTFDSPQIQTHLRSLLDHPNSEVRHYAIISLGIRVITDRDVYAGLVKGLGDQNATVKGDCRYVLKKNSKNIPPDIKAQIQNTFPQEVSYIFN